MKNVKKVLWLCAALPLAAGAGKALAGDGFFPVCMYGAASVKDLAVIKEAGFNCFHTYNHDPGSLAAMAAEADQLGLKMAAYPDKVIGSAYSEKAKKWPMLAWYLYDEPEVGKLHPDGLKKLDAAAKAWSPEQRTAFVMGDGAAAATYGGIADALMVDWYPVPHLPLESVGRHVSLAKAAAAALSAPGTDKPLWAVLQAFDWKIYPQSREHRRVGRFPEFSEIRFMTWLALARGADGIFYFTLAQEGGTLADRPERWHLFKRMAAELNAFGPLLADAKEAEPPTGLDPSLAARALSSGGRRCLILLNPTRRNIPLDAGKLKGWRPLFEEKRRLEAVLPGGKNLYLPPCRALVLEKKAAGLMSDRLP